MTETRADLGDLNISTKTHNALRRGGIHTCAQLLHTGRAEVRKLRWIGPGAEHEIATGLANIQASEWTEEGAPLPALSSNAAQVVEALGLGDSPAIRQGLARVLKVSLYLDRQQHRAAAGDLEHDAR